MLTLNGVCYSIGSGVLYLYMGRLIIQALTFGSISTHSGDAYFNVFIIGLWLTLHFSSVVGSLEKDIGKQLPPSHYFGFFSLPFLSFFSFNVVYGGRLTNQYDTEKYGVHYYDIIGGYIAVVLTVFMIAVSVFYIKYLFSKYFSEICELQSNGIAVI